MKGLIGFSETGLADRVRTLCAGRRLAESMGWKFAFIWTPNEECAATFHDLFEPQPFRVFDKDPVVEIPITDYVSAPWVEVEQQLKDHPADYVKFHTFLGGGFQKCDRLRLRFRRSIERKAFRILNRLQGHAMGCHVRTLYEGMKPIRPPLEAWFEHVDKLLATGIFSQCFVAADAEEAIEAFRRRYGDFVFALKGRLGQDCYDAVIRAAIELTVFRHLPALVLSPWSGLSRMALSYQIPRTLEPITVWR